MTAERLVRSLPIMLFEVRSSRLLGSDALWSRSRRQCRVVRQERDQIVLQYISARPNVGFLTTHGEKTLRFRRSAFALLTLPELFVSDRKESLDWQNRRAIASGSRLSLPSN